jgi:hypothetical protein
MSDPYANLVSSWMTAVENAMLTYGGAITSVLESAYQEQPVPGINDARVIVAASPSASSTGAPGTLTVQRPVNEDGVDIPVQHVTIEPPTTAPNQATEVWITIDPPSGVPSGFYTTTLYRNNAIVVSDILIYVVETG